MQILTVGLGGGSGAGKTTVAHAIMERLGREHFAYIQHDAYYRDQRDVPLEVRARMNYDHPDSLETDLLIQHLQQLRSGQAVEIPIYDFSQHTRTERRQRIEPRPIILVEGILIFVDPVLWSLLDLKLFVDAPPDLRFIRRLQRDLSERRRTVESVIRQYLETVRPMHLEYVEPTKRYADVIVPAERFNAAAVEILAAGIRAKLGPERLAN